MGFLNRITFIILLINIYQFIFLDPVVASTDVLKPGDRFNYSSTLVSSKGNFTLGFSRLVPSSNSTYLRTWDTMYNQIGWIANPYMPILNDWDGVVLKLDYSGTLKVVNSSGVTLFYIFNNPQQKVGYSAGNYTRAVLEDSGNFIVYDHFNRTLWQSSEDSKKVNWEGIIFTLMLFILPFLVVTMLLVYCCCVRIRSHRREVKKKKRRDDIHQLIGTDSFNYGDQLEKDIKDAPNVKVFSLKAILNATNNFSNENKLGQGGYGPVYKGILSDGREIAVKRLSKTSGQGVGEFKNELILITKLQHTNLVRLYGCCVHQEEKMLVYEFMPNKSLDFFLFANDNKEKIDWHIRFNIIEGVAQGMLYLHKYSRMKVIHRDLKVSNVLLDENMTPKIADFGMARIFQQNMIEAMTNRVVGTYGYMAPEYAMEGTFSIKSDVFSFGVLILEIISGKKNSTLYNLDRTVNLVGYAWELWKGQASLELKDETLCESFDVKQLLRATHVGLLCVQEDADDRPSMSQVISMLNNEIADLPNPKKPAFFVPRHAVEVGSPVTRSTDYFLGEILPVSVNGLTMTTMEAR